MSSDCYWILSTWSIKDPIATDWLHLLPKAHSSSAAFSCDKITKFEWIKRGKKESFVYIDGNSSGWKAIKEFDVWINFFELLTFLSWGKIKKNLPEKVGTAVFEISLMSLFWRIIRKPSFFYVPLRDNLRSFHQLCFVIN